MTKHKSYYKAVIYYTLKPLYDEFTLMSQEKVEW